MELKGSRTEKNLLGAFAGESQARNRYTFFASKAKAEGYRQISEIFTETANQEKEHAERFFKFLRGGEVEITAAFPAGVIGSTLENLLAAAGGEHHEWSALYPSFAETAKEEGFKEIAARTDITQNIFILTSRFSRDTCTCKVYLFDLVRASMTLKSIFVPA